MPRLIQLVALSLALLVMGAPAIVAEITEDDCAEECAGEREDEDCSDQGCADCSLVCSSCPRTHVVVSPMGAALVLLTAVYVDLSPEVSERVPVGPPPQGVFHPPRIAG